MIKIQVSTRSGSLLSKELVLIEQTKFKGGEVNVKIPDELLTPYFGSVPLLIDIKAHISDADGLMALMLTADAVRREWPGCTIRLFIPYLPYARQDRVCNRGEALSLALVGRMINSLEAETVTILDAHSEGAVLAINNCVNLSPLQYISAILAQKDHPVTLLSPDAGALKKTYSYAKELRIAEVLTASKLRDTATNKISHTEVYGNVEGKDIFIVDDICDGGRTFIELSKKLDEVGVKSKSLFVTHGIFSHGYDEIAKHFDLIYSTNSFHGKGEGNLRPDGVRDDKYWFFLV